MATAHTHWLLIAALTSLSACSNKPELIQPIALYSDKQAVQLSYCAELSDTAYMIADQKLRDVPKSALITRYGQGSSATINVNVVQDVYKAEFSDAWQYAVALFDQCALKVAEVPKARLNMASYCAQKSLIAGATFDLKQRGEPKYTAYETFAAFKPTKPFEVIDEIYEDDDVEADIAPKTWEQCIAVVAG